MRAVTDRLYDTVSFVRNGISYTPGMYVYYNDTINIFISSIFCVFSTNAFVDDFVLEKWNVSNVTNMNSMFERAEAFNQPLEKWNVSNVTNMNSMFKQAKAFNQPLEKWNVSNVKVMVSMFHGTKAFNQPLEKWSVSSSY